MGVHFYWPPFEYHPTKYIGRHRQYECQELLFCSWYVNPSLHICLLLRLGEGDDLLPGSKEHFVHDEPVVLLAKEGELTGA